MPIRISVKFLVPVLFISSIYVLNGQGCSDAGFCTLNSFKPNHVDTPVSEQNQIKAGVSLGSADHSISIAGTYLEYNRQINQNFGIDTKISALAQAGNDISVFGLSDIYLSGNYAINESVKFTLGAKIPLSDGNKTKENLALPMDYQSSLGTFDLIFGLGYHLRNFQFVAAWQQPLSQNKNEFVAELYDAASKISTFQSTNKFERSGDILVRVSYPIKWGDKFIITPGILPIYHLRDDKFTDTTGAQKDIEGSQGLTLNGNIYVDYELNRKNALQLNLGIPFIVRDARPDGLTRSFVLNLEYRMRF